MTTHHPRLQYGDRVTITDQDGTTTTGTISYVTMERDPDGYSPATTTITITIPEPHHG